MIENELQKSVEAEKKAEERKMIKEHWQVKLMNFFDKVSILRQTDEQKQEIALNIKGQLNVGRLYWIQIILSSLIATFGLLQNSVAVIIGAMLIAPLLQPIQGIAYGISEGDSKLVWRSSKLLIFSYVLSVFLAYLVVLFLPVHMETSEILARTSPNIFDLFIAVASSIIALLSLSYKKLLGSVAGVAMAASLMPPLSVIGIELALGLYINAWGAFVLFITNIVAILFVGVIIFIFYGFRPHKEDSEKTAQNIGILSLIILILSVPLISGLTKISRKIEIESQSKQIILEILADKIPDASLNNIELHGAISDKINLSADIKLPENIDFFAEIMDETTDELSKKLGKNVQLDLDIIRTASIISKKQKSPLKVQITEALKDIFNTNVSDGILVRTEVTEIPDSENVWSVKSLYTIAAGKILEQNEKKFLQRYLSKRFPDLELKQLWVQLAEHQNSAKLSEQTEADEQQAQYSAKIEQFLQENITEGSFDNLEVQIDIEKNILQADVDVFVPIENIAEFTKNFSRLVTEFEETLSFTEKKFDYKIFPYYQKVEEVLPAIKEE